jgi:hypothetical protein
MRAELVYIATNAVIGRAMAHAVSCQPLSAEARVRAPVSPCGISGGRSDTGTGFSPSSSVFFCQYYSTVFIHIHHLGMNDRPVGGRS